MLLSKIRSFFSTSDPRYKPRPSVREALTDPKLLLRESLAGLVVAIALIPEAIAFSILAGVDPRVGLFASFVMAITTAVLGGRPAMISAATGAVALVIAPVARDYGIDYFLATVILAGVFQLVLGIAGAAKLMRFIPRSVMIGFVNSLAILIFMAQLPHLIDVPFAVYPLVALGLVVMVILPRFTKVIPAPLVAIVLVMGTVVVTGLNVPTVGDEGELPQSLPELLTPNVPLTMETFNIIAPFALAMALVGLLESLLTAKLVDEITDTHSQKTRESLAQGVGNIISGFFGGMGGCAMIGQSMINMKSGARWRLSGALAALLLLAYILVASSLIEQIPIAALVGVMFVVVIGTFSWSSLRIIRKVPVSDAFVMILVSAVTVATDLAIAVIVGVIVSALVFAWNTARSIYVVDETPEGEPNRKVYTLHGQLFFASITAFRDLFHPPHDPQEVVIDFRHSRVWDHSGIEAIVELARRYEAADRELHLLHLSENCQRILSKANVIIDRDPEADPSYRVTVSGLGGDGGH